MHAVRLAFAVACALASARPASATVPQQAPQASCAASETTASIARGDAAFKAAKHAEAIRYYTVAATCGRADAQRRLGVMLLGGQGTPKDEKAAAEWLDKAATQGDAIAQLGIATQLRLGRGVVKDEAAAHKWFIAAADQGLAEAQFSAGAMLLGTGSIKADQAEAAKWFYKAALQGHAQAQSALALIEISVFTFDNTQRQSIVRAYVWARLADRSSCSATFKPSAEVAAAEPHRQKLCADNQNVRKFTSDSLTANELDDAGKLADSWKPGSTAVPAPPHEIVAQLPLAVDVVRSNKDLRERAQTKPTRTRELVAVDRWMIGQAAMSGVQTLIAVLPVPERAKEKGSIRLVCPERSSHGPLLILSHGLFDTPPAAKTMVQQFNGHPVIGAATGTEVVIPIEVSIALARPEPHGNPKPDRIKLTADMLNSADGALRFRLDGNDAPEIVIRPRLPYADAAKKDGMAGLLHRDFKPGDLREALVRCRGFVKPSF